MDMKKTRLLALVMSLVMVAGSCGGCRRNETADTDKYDSGSKRAAASDTGDGKETDPGDSTASSQDPSNSTAQRDPSKITISSPDDSVVRGMADEWRSNNSAIFVLTDHGEYRSTDENMFFSSYLQLTAEYVFSEEYYETTVAQMNTADMTYAGSGEVSGAGPQTQRTSGRSNLLRGLGPVSERDLYECCRAGADRAGRTDRDGHHLR